MTGSVKGYQMTERRKVPFITFAEHPDQGRKAWINLSGCNFDCRACFAIAKHEVGTPLSVEELVSLVIKSCEFIWGKGKMVDRTVITGGEPTVNARYLVALIRRLRELWVTKFELSTNGYLLDTDLLDELRSLEVDLLVKLDLKAYNDEVHRWYPGKSNTNVLRAVELLHEYGLNFYVRTIFIPNIVDVDEIEKIAEFVSHIDRSILYRIFQFAPEHGNSAISRRPSREEMLRAANIAQRHLENVVISTSASSRPEYNYVEVRADELLEHFNKIDEISRSILSTWDMRYVGMDQIIGCDQKRI